MTSFAQQCALVLDMATATTLEKDMVEVDLTIMQAIALNPDIVKALTEEVNKLQNNKS